MTNSGQLPSSTRRTYPGHMGRPRLVRDLAEISAELAAAAQAALSPADTVERIFYVPPQEFPSWARYRYGPEHALIFTADRAIHVQGAAAGQPGQTRVIPAVAMHYLQVEQNLLYGRLEIGYAADGQAQQMVLEFNTVAWDMLQPGLAGLLLEANRACPPSVAADAPEIGMHMVERLPLKYANGLKFYILAPGERLLALAFQPAIWMRRLLILRRQVTPAIVLALTDRHVSLIEEERALGRSPSYGWIFTFIPRHGVTGMRAAPAPLGRLISIDMLVDGSKATREVEVTAQVAEAWAAQWRDHGGGWSAVVAVEGAPCAGHHHRRRPAQAGQRR